MAKIHLRKQKKKKKEVFFAKLTNFHRFFAAKFCPKRKNIDFYHFYTKIESLFALREQKNLILD